MPQHSADGFLEQVSANKHFVFTSNEFAAAAESALRHGALGATFLLGKYDEVPAVSNADIWINPSPFGHNNASNLAQLVGSEPIEAFLRHPDRGNVVFVAPPKTVLRSSTMWGQPVWGQRRPEWHPLEDKAFVDKNVFAKVEISSPQVSVSRAGDPEFLKWIEQFRYQSVWSNGGDVLNGGGLGVRIAHGRDEAMAIQASLSKSDKESLIRVSEFIEGTSCGIGFLSGHSGVEPLIPLEMIVFELLNQERRLRFAGVSTALRPKPALENEFYRVSKAIGTYLRNEFGYRGAAGIDVIADSRRVFPLEINPRFALGFEAIARQLPTGDLHLLNVFLTARQDANIPFDLHRFAAEVRAAVRNNPQVVLKPVLYRLDDAEQVALVPQQGEYTWRNGGWVGERHGKGEVFMTATSQSVARNFSECTFSIDGASLGGRSAAPYAAAINNQFDTTAVAARPTGTFNRDSWQLQPSRSSLA